VSSRGADHLLNWFSDTRDLESRFAAWQDGWQVFRDFPLFGIGLNTYGTAMLFYQRSNEGSHLGSAHNDYLQLLAEGGLLVTVPAAIVVICLIVAIRRNLVAARHESRGYWIRAGAAVGLLGIAVQEAADFSLQIPANAFLFCTLAAIALAPVAARQGVTRSVNLEIE
jgi:O-antigen ligase